MLTKVPGVRRPFEPVDYATLPEAPRRPHALSRARRETLQLNSRAFGRHRVVYRELGEGPPLLLVHGLMTSSYSFRYVIEPLARKFRVIAPDLVGAGESDKPDVSYEPQALASFIVEFVRALDIVGCRAVGNSLGGYLCLRAALSEPEIFDRLVNVHSPGVPDPRLKALASALALPGVSRALGWVVRRDPERWAHRHVHYYDETLKSREEAREYGRPLASVAGARAFVRYLSDTLSPSAVTVFVRELERRRDRGEAFPVPLLLLYARQDPMVPPRVGERLAALIPSAELKWLEDTSHFAHVDTPELFLDATRDFLAADFPGHPPLSSSRN